MIDFNDPKMTTQMKKDLLSLSIPENADKRFRDQVIADEKGLGKFSSPSYWVVKPHQLMEMNNWCINETDLMFNFHEYAIEGLHPESDIVLMEHDSVKKGEWDALMSRTSPYGFTQTNVIVFNGSLDTEIPTGIDEEMVGYSTFSNTDELFYDYPTSYKHKDEPIFGMGLLDCPIHYLNEIEDQRTNKRTWIFSKFYEDAMRNFCDISFGSSHSSRKSKKTKRRDKGFG